MKRKKIKQMVAENPVQLAIERACITTPQRNAKYVATERAALSAAAAGTADRMDWHELTHMANMAEIMAANGIGHEVIPFAAAAQVVLARAQVGYATTRQFRFSPEDMACLRELHEYYELQRLSITYGEYLRWEKKVIDTVRGGGATPSAKFLEGANEAAKPV